ncbi:Hypothetical protein UVM_LOCUS350 [uncultured virus]|nr:Hypothetical protein UVM_LOCUS350 [uncultured virus]
MPSNLVAGVPPLLQKSEFCLQYASELPSHGPFELEIQAFDRSVHAGERALGPTANAKEATALLQHRRADAESGRSVHETKVKQVHQLRQRDPLSRERIAVAAVLQRCRWRHGLRTSNQVESVRV